MKELENRLNVTTERLEEIREELLTLNDENILYDLNLTYTNMIKQVFTVEQFKAYNSNEMTKALCNDLFKF